MLAALALAIDGCGGGAMSAHDRFVARANAICAEVQEHANELGRPTGGPSYYARAQVQTADFGKVLSRVEPPPATRAAYERFVASVQREAGYLAAFGRYEDQAERAQGEHDPTGWKKARAGLRRVLVRMDANPVNGEARTLGLTKCAETAVLGH